MNLEEHRQTANEQLRITNLMTLIPEPGGVALDIGTRDGYLAEKLTQYFDKVIAVDLEKPIISHDKIEAQIGNITELNFSNNTFDLVLCSEVLEHIPPKLLTKACNELSRVTKKYLLIGVPYNQDIRLGRTSCNSCGKKNPPWGHVNKFDLSTLKTLFPQMSIEKTDYVGVSQSVTNFMSVFLMDLAGNPYGTYGQSESCVHCDNKLSPPNPMNIFQKIIAKLSIVINRIQKSFIKNQANWIHVLFIKS